jgi:hypothetical protein
MYSTVLLINLTATCPEMTSLAELVGSVAALLKPDPGNEAWLAEWTRSASAGGLPYVHGFTRGLNID